MLLWSWFTDLDSQPAAFLLEAGSQQKLLAILIKSLAIHLKVDVKVHLSVELAT